MSDWPEPEIEYPTSWSYKVIGESEEGLRLAIALAVGGRSHAVLVSRRSSGGRYVSLRLELSVESHADRRGIADRLNENADVKFVL